jgi:hypothetical protein
VSSWVNCCWSSPAQPTFVSGPVGAHDRIFVFRFFSCCEIGPPLRRHEESDYCLPTFLTLHISYPDEVNGFFSLPNPSSCTMARVYSASNGNEYQEYSWGVKSERHVRLSISPPSLSPLSRKCGILDVLQPYSCISYAKMEVP